MPKRSTSETGHQRNLTNLEKLLVSMINLGPAFNPTRPELQINGLQQLHQEAKMVLIQMAEREVIDKNASNLRSKAFKNLRPLVTRILNNMIANGLPAKMIEDARVIQRRMNGVRADNTTNGTPIAAPPIETEDSSVESNGSDVATAPKTISVSHQSMDLLVEYLAKLVLLLQQDYNYNANEAELQIGSLQMHVEELRYLNTQVINAEVELENTRMRRDTIMYDKVTGLVVRAQQIKSYIKAVFGSTSPQYKQISGLYFRYV